MVTTINILIVDDQEAVASLFSRMLESLPRVKSVISCASVEEAHAIMKELLVHVVVLDLFLGSSDGLETLKKFRLLCPEIPVVVVTGHDSDGLSYRCFEEGASDYLVKPDISAPLLYKACLYSVEKDIIYKKGKVAEDTLKSLLKIAPIGVGMAVDRKIKWVNDYMCELVARGRSELEGSDARILYPSAEEYARVGNEKYPRVYNEGRGVVETQWVTGDGYTKDILLGSSAIGPGSHSAGVIFTALDITKLKKANREIQDERDKARQYLDIAGTIILILDLDGNVSLINRKGCEILGYSSEELIGKNWFDTCILPEDREEVRGVFHTLLSDREGPSVAEEHENYIVRKDGETRLISWTNSYITDNCKVVSISSGEDVTEQRKTEQALRESEEKYRTAIESAGEGILIVQNEIIKYVNTRITEILGYTAEELVGKGIQDVVHPSYYELVAQRHEARMAREEVDNNVYQIKCIHKDGSIVDIDLRVTTMLWEGGTAALGFVIDITERVILEERQGLIIDALKVLNRPYVGVQTIEELLKLIQESAGIEAIAIRLQDGRDYPYFFYTGFRDEFIERENLLCPMDEKGCPHVDSEGHPVLDCMCGCVIRGHTDSSLPCFTERGSFWTNSTTELLKEKARLGGPLTKHKTRNECNMEGYESVAIVPLIAGDEIIGSLQLNDSQAGKYSDRFISFIEELALSIAVAVKRAWQEDRIKTLEIAKTKDLLQSSRLLNSGIAHELRTPMQALLNCLELIKEEVGAYCEECEKNSDCETKNIILELANDGIDRTGYSVKVLNSLSEYSKIASGEEVHLINVVPELKTIMRTLAFTDQFKSLGSDGFFLKEVGSNGECFVSINRIDFSQLITNLCRNAREAIDHDDPEVNIIVEEDAPHVTIKVTDNGRGIDSNLGDKIFEPYFSTKENPEGYNQGLGLAMVREIIAAYGGTITYNSKPGYTEFIVKLPCEHKG